MLFRAALLLLLHLPNTTRVNIETDGLDLPAK